MLRPLLRPSSTEPAGHTAELKAQATTLFNKLIKVLPELADSKTLFGGAIGKVTLDPAGNTAIDLALFQVVQRLTQSEFDDVVADTVRDAGRYDHVTMIRCGKEIRSDGRVSGSGTGPSHTIDKEPLVVRIQKASLKWRQHMQDVAKEKAGLSADPGKQPEAESMSIIEALLKPSLWERVSPRFDVSEQWEPSATCLVRLCTGNCEPSSFHAALGTESTTSPAGPPFPGPPFPGCGHNKFGLCAMCEPFRTDTTLHCCAQCGHVFRNPVKQALTLAHVTVAATSDPKTAATGDTKLDPKTAATGDTKCRLRTGHVKRCYLVKAGKINSGTVYALTSSAVEGLAKMDDVEIKMLAAAIPQSQTQNVADHKYHIVETSSLGTHGGGLCGSCVQKTVTGAAAVVADEVEEVKILHTQDDLIGLVAALAVASNDEEKEGLRDTFTNASNSATMVPKHIKEFLTTLSKPAGDLGTR